MTSYDYFKQQKEQLERQKFQAEIRFETEMLVQTAMRQIKEEILAEIKQEIDIQVNLLMNGKQIDNVDIGKIVADEVLQHIKSSI